ncbi:electron transporter RnfB [Pseudomonas daroniae]|uniref:Electron transporter RnfB n=1 Tax=Phytopseudomonas daroniae TaxID=2487519 RepID=A0A4Q9QM55_9GAMM|nr:MULTISPECIES: RnfABCDGE type electron transport complex subunit B [Pseudomonas]TBU77713.1 electron transporter RnfB [Pseudomonas daroniae]TBU86164.1 electron transporter RnfB [Pseudomonas sp. FRB 228]TBU95327.1 electron transporter RnfB [Pseudomonas daroniae]
MSNALRIAAIDALLPQTQCGKCGHPGCQPYAEGIAAGEAINKCPPGGTATIHALADLLQVPELPLALPATPAQIAVIREDECIGCTKCIQACPVDAIVGAAKLMHTVITDECSGCELCIAPCPVDCIDLITLSAPQATIQRERADQFRARHQARLSRLAREDARRRAARSTPITRPRSAAVVTSVPATDDNQAARLKRLKIEAAMAKVAYEKIRKQVAMHPDSPFAAQLDALQSASERAAAALQAAQNETPSTVTASAATDEGALKRAKIDAAMSRAQLQKALKAFGEAPDEPQRQQLDTLRQAADKAQRRLAELLPDTAGEAPSAGEQALKQAKIKVASRRAALQSGERRGVDGAMLSILRADYAAAQQALHDAEQQCGKPAPQRILVDRPGVSAELRQLKTDLAYARADLSKLQRNAHTDEHTLNAALERLATAERRLQAHTSAT